MSRPFANYQYSAFLSYSAYDDTGWNSFVTHFAKELDVGLPSRARIQVPKAYRCSESPILSGSLDEELRKTIDSSFFMFLFVHDWYVDSEWCLKELEHFKNLLGNDGFRDRLYVIAMSKDAIDRLVKSPNWKALCPFKDQVWLKFWEPENENMPLTIYEGRPRDAIIVDPFKTSFWKLREDLAKKIRSVVENEKRVSSYPNTLTRAAQPDPNPQSVRVYIEGNKDQEPCWESLEQQIKSSWQNVLAPMDAQAPLHLNPTGLPMNEIDQHSTLDDADGVVLLWGRKSPDSLVAQIKKVEPKLSGPHVAPGMIAYLNADENSLPGEVSVGNWKVVRFRLGADGNAEALPSDKPILAHFMSTVLERKRQRSQQHSR